MRGLVHHEVTEEDVEATLRTLAAVGEPLSETMVEALAFVVAKEPSEVKTQFARYRAFGR